jgi:hypothetical protein
MAGWPRPVAVTLVIAVALAAAGAGAYAASLPECITDSQPPPTVVIIRSAPCGTYSTVLTRRDAVAQVETDVAVAYMVHAPAGLPRPKALVVLLPGGEGSAGLTGDPNTGQVFTANNNFLVRSAQLFAERGYLAVTIDRPSVFPSTPAEVFGHRLSARHAQDIVTIVARVNQANLDVFLAGTSASTISVVAQWMLGAGSMLSSPLTSGPPGTGYLGAPGFPMLQPSFVRVPVHVMAHALDACFSTSPAGASALHAQFVAAGVPSEFDLMTGGFDQSSDPAVGPCGARAYHGFLGIENTAVSEITARMDAVLQAMAAAYPGNRRPIARGARVRTNVRAPAVVNLAALTADPDRDRLTFFLPHATSSRGAMLAMAGPTVQYWPSQPGITDGFVYGVSDGRGGMSAGVVVVDVISGVPR